MAMYFRKVESLPDEEMALLDDYYINIWDEKDPIILVYEDEEGKVLGMAGVAIMRGLPSLRRNRFSRIGFVLDVSVDKSSR